MNPLYDAIFRGMAPLAKNAVQASLDEGKSPQDIIDESMIPAMEAIGKEFEAGRVFVPNLLLSARAMKTALDILKPLMLAGQTTTLGTVVIGTVKGDLHDIGKNLVASMLEDVSKERFIEAAKENGADIIAMSALLTTTMDYMKEVVDAVKADGLKVKTMIGGAPVTAEFAVSIGADGFSTNANEAVEVAKRLLS